MNIIQMDTQRLCKHEIGNWEESRGGRGSCVSWYNLIIYYSLNGFF